MVVPRCDSKKHENNPNDDEPFNNRLRQILATTNDEDRVLALRTEKNPNEKINSIPTDEAIIYDIPQDFKDAIKAKNGTDLKLVIQKEVTKSDINKGLGRFLIPYLQIEDKSFLSEEEIATLEEEIYHGTKKKRKGIDLKLVQPSLIDADLCLKKWPFENTINYVLISSWNKIVNDNSCVIKAGALMRLFSFRVDGKLWLALIPTSHRGENSGRGKMKSASKNSIPSPVIVHVPVTKSSRKMIGASKSQNPKKSGIILVIKRGKEASCIRKGKVKCSTQRPSIVPSLAIKRGEKTRNSKVKCTHNVPSLEMPSGNRKRSRKGIPIQARYVPSIEELRLMEC